MAKIETKTIIYQLAVDANTDLAINQNGSYLVGTSEVVEFPVDVPLRASGIAGYIQSLAKPNCAVQVNGNFLEDLIPGYRTSSVSGRNADKLDITEIEIGNAAGSRYRRKREQTKDIQVNFAIIKSDLASVHLAARLLRKFLDSENIHFIFNDEPSMYWIGNVNEFTEEYPDFSGEDDKAAMTGSFTIHCSDPRRYATVETRVTTNGINGTNAVELINNGSAPTPIRIDAYMWGGTRYLAYNLEKNSSESMTYILGKAIDVTKKNSVTTPSTVLDDSFGSDSGWVKNAGITPPLASKGDQVGSMNFSSKVQPGNYGEGSYWHGPSITKVLPAQNGSYPTNWRANWNFDFDCSGTGSGRQGGQGDGNAKALQAVTLADGGGEPIVSVGLVDSDSSTDTHVIAWGNRTRYDLGTYPKNNLHLATGGNVTVEKNGLDVHVTLSYPRANEHNTVTHKVSSGSNGTQETHWDASSNWHEGVLIRYYAWFKELSVDPNSNKSVIQWAANAVQWGETRFVGRTRPHAGIINVNINGSCVCSEYVPLVSYARDQVVWESGWRTFEVPHEADGSKQVSCTLEFRAGVDDVGNSVYYWGAGNTVGITLNLSKIDTVVNKWIDSSGEYTFDKHFTVNNPNTAIRQVTLYEAAWENDYSESVDENGVATSTSGHQHFSNNAIRSFKLIRNPDNVEEAKTNNVYFAPGDSVIVDCNPNTVMQNGIINWNIVDITSEPLILYPGKHLLKVSTDSSNPTLLITYREQWK